MKDAEAVNTFNMGFGWVAVVPSSEVEKAIACLDGAIALGPVVPEHGVRVTVG